LAPQATITMAGRRLSASATPLNFATLVGSRGEQAVAGSVAARIDSGRRGKSLFKDSWGCIGSLLGSPRRLGWAHSIFLFEVDRDGSRDSTIVSGVGADGGNFGVGVRGADGELAGGRGCGSFALSFGSVVGCAVSASRRPHPSGEGGVAPDLQGFLPGEAVRRMFNGQFCEGKAFVNVNVKVNRKTKDFGFGKPLHNVPTFFRVLGFRP